MATIDAGVLDAIRLVVGEAMRPLDERLARVETEQQAQHVVLREVVAEQQTQRAVLQEVVAEQQTQRSILHSIETTLDERFTHLDQRLTVLEADVQTIEARTARLSSDLLDLTERVTEGFQTFKREIAQAFRDIGSLQNGQQRHQRQLNELRERLELLERRINRLEDPAGGVV